MRRSKRVRLRNTNRINMLVAQRKKYWTRINAELAERQRVASTMIQCTWRSMKARMELQRRKEVKARRFLQRVWRGCIARHGIVWIKRKEREQNRFRHRVLFRLSNQIAVWALNGWLTYVKQEQLWRQRLYLARHTNSSFKSNSIKGKCMFSRCASWITFSSGFCRAFASSTNSCTNVCQSNVAIK